MGIIPGQRECLPAAASAGLVAGATSMPAFTGYRRGAIYLSILALFVLAQDASAVSASGSARAFHAARIRALAQRCSHRNRAAGTITIGFVPFGSLDLFGAANFPLWESLFESNDTGRLLPQMASAVPTLKNGGILGGGKTVVIHLKQGLRWSNGTEITSADVRFGWQLGRDPASGGCDWCAIIAGIDTPDRYTIVFHMKQKGSSLLYWLGLGVVSPWPVVWPHAWSHDPHAAALKLNQDPTWTWIGSGYPTDGPYYLASSTDTQAVLLPMKYYTTMSCGAYLSRIIVRAYPSAAAVLAAAASHDVDLMPYVDNLSLLPELQRHRNAYTTHLAPGLLIESMPFNDEPTYQGKPNPVHDARVRLALALALNKTRLTRQALPLNRLEASRLEVWSPWVNTPKLVEQYADRSITGQWDPLANGGRGAYVANTGSGPALADARKLLAQTRWKHGFTLDLYTTTNNPTRQVEEQEVVTDWAGIGVRVTPHFVSGTQLFARYEAGGILAHGLYQTAIFAQVWGEGGPASIGLLLDSKYIPTAKNVLPGGIVNDARIRDAVLDRSFEQAAATFDHRQLAAIYAAAQRRFARMGYWLMLYSHPGVWTDDRRIEGLHAPTAGGGISSSWNWKLKH